MPHDQPSRRTFLRGAGTIVGASAIAGRFLLSGAPDPAFGSVPAASAGLADVDHVVVLMMENRSFDNVVGWLYDSGSVPGGQPFDGLSGKVLSNPVPGGGTASPGPETVLYFPNPDPGELFDDVYASLFNTTDPPIPNRADVPGMQGFVNNYAAVIADYNGKHPSDPINTDPRIIMNGYEPATLPVLNGLASGYAVCDHWFSSIPTQTFCNRSFVHAGTSSGYVNNKWSTGPNPWDVGIFSNATPTIFNLLEAAGVTWKLYYGGSLAFCNAFLTQQAIVRYATNDSATNRLSPMPDFYADVAGNLPSYSFIEPHFLSSSKYGPENDGHPPYNPFEIDGPSNLLRAEELVSNVYSALRDSPNWERTLLVITCDEHGGCYDHVPPPQTVSPDGKVVPTSEPGGSGFDFTRLGVRVPAILVSPFIAAGTVVNTPVDHTSIIKTVINSFGVRDGTGQPATLLAREVRGERSGGGADAVFTTDRHRVVPAHRAVAVRRDHRATTLGFPVRSRRGGGGTARALRRPLPYNWTELATTEEATQELEGRIEALRALNTRTPAPPPVPVTPKFTG